MRCVFTLASRHMRSWARRQLRLKNFEKLVVYNEKNVHEKKKNITRLNINVDLLYSSRFHSYYLILILTNLTQVCIVIKNKNIDLIFTLRYSTWEAKYLMRVKFIFLFSFFLVDCFVSKSSVSLINSTILYLLNHSRDNLYLMSKSRLAQIDMLLIRILIM